MTHRQLTLRYFLELLSAHVLFFATLFTSDHLASTMPPGLARQLALASPAIPAALMLLAVFRFYRSSDEYLRQQMLENWAITAAITFLWTFTYGLLENTGLPHLNLVWICPAMAMASMAVYLVRFSFIRHLT
jgi:hypothetical protein